MLLVPKFNLASKHAGRDRGRRPDQEGGSNRHPLLTFREDRGLVLR